MLDDVGIFSAGADKLKGVLEKGQEFIFATAIGEEEGKVGWEIGGLDDDIFGELFGFEGFLADVFERRRVLHIFIIIELTSFH